ncbi:MAG: flagellar type III secretion system pore protein FliP [Pirellulaceae bacterium]
MTWNQRTSHQRRPAEPGERSAPQARRGGTLRTTCVVLLAMWMCLWSGPSAAVAQTATQTTSGSQAGSEGVSNFLTSGPETWTSPQGLTSAMQIMLLLTVLSLAPAVLLMTTSFVRIVVVLGLLRQALGTQQLPPSQVITALALFMTLMVMTPVWKDVYDSAIGPYTDPRSQMSLEEAWQRGSFPIKRFMARQIDAAGNAEDIHMFYRYMPPDTPVPQTFDDVPLQVLLPAYMMSELKTAFLIGFQIYLPFLILDIVVASVAISMGMMMLPPVMISLPFKLMLFVLVDGWRLVVSMLLESFGPLY